MLNIYLAGPLFTRGEMKSRLDDEQYIKDALSKHINLTIFNPINLNKNNSVDSSNLESLPKDFFAKNDIKAIDECDIMIADIDNNDAGTLVELGMMVEKIRQFPHKRLLVIYSNWKGEVLMNKFLLGTIAMYGEIFKSIEEVVDWIKEVYYENSFTNKL